MRIVGAILLVLGIFSAIGAFSDKPRKAGSEAYQTGYRAGRVVAPLILLGLGSWLLMRGGHRGPRRELTPSRPPSRVSTGSAVPPPIPSSRIAVKIQCSCGQNYAFEVEPVAGRMPGPVTCPSCGTDGTDAANAYIAGVLATRSQIHIPAVPPLHEPQPRKRRLHPVLLGLVALVGVLMLAFVVAVITRVVANASRTALPPRRSAEPGLAPPPPGAPPRTARPSGAPSTGRPGNPREAAPVPADMTAVEVYWGNRWWPATILRREGNRAYIHYEGWSAGSDEWVTPDRLRPRP